MPRIFPEEEKWTQEEPNIYIYIYVYIGGLKTDATH